MSGKGLGRSLGYVGRNQITVFMVLHAALVHKLPCEAVSQAFTWSQSCLTELFLKLVHGAAVQNLLFEANL